MIASRVGYFNIINFETLWMEEEIEEATKYLVGILSWNLGVVVSPVLAARVPSQNALEGG